MEVKVDMSLKDETSDVSYAGVVLPCVHIAQMRREKMAERTLKMDLKRLNQEIFSLR